MQLMCKNVVQRLQMDSKGSGYTGTDVQLGWHRTSTSTSAAQHKQLHTSFHKPQSGLDFSGWTGTKA